MSHSPPHPRPTRVRLWLAIGSVLLGVLGPLLCATPAQAHAALVGSEPGDGQALPTAPAEVVLRFNEPVEPPRTPIRVFDADGARVDLDDGGNGPDLTTLRVSLPPELADGVYVVAWRAISADSHPIRGSLVFSVGEAIADPADIAAPPPDTGVGWQIAAGVTRWLTYVGALVAAGGVGFFLLVAGPALASRPGPVAPTQAVRVIGLAVAAGVVGTVTSLPLQAVVVSGEGGGALADADLLAATVTSSAGASALVRLAGLTLLFIGVAGWATVRYGRPVALLGAAGVLGSFLLTGHIVTADPRLWFSVSHIAHTTTAALWTGGLILLVLLLRQQRRSGGEAAAAAQAVSRFSTMAVVSVVVAAVAGTVLVLSEVRSWNTLVSTGYGWTLLAKVGLVALVVAVGGYNNRSLVPAIRRSASPEGESRSGNGTDVDSTGGAAWRRLHRTVRVEAVVLLVAVLGVTSALVVLPPTGDQDSPAQAATAGPYDAVHPLGPEHQVRLTVDPALTGENQLTVSVLDTAENPVDLGTEMELRMRLPEAEIDWIARAAEPTGEPSVFQHTGPELSIAGTWEIEVRIQVDDFQRLTATAEVPIGAGDPGHHQHD